MQPFDTPTVQNIYDTIIADYESRTGETVPLLKKAAIKFLAFAFAGVVVLLWRYGAWQYLQIFVQTADLDALKLWGAQVGIDYQVGDTAVLTGSVTGATASIITTEASYLSPDNGIVYKVQANAPVSGGNATITVAALQTGSIGNLDNGSIINLTNPLTGVPETATIASTVTIGSDDESTKAYRARVLAAYSNPPQGGSASDYFQWSTEVTEIVDAYVYVITPGQVRVYPVKDGSGTDRVPGGSVSPNPFPEYVGGLEQPITGTGLLFEVAESINSDGNGVQNRRPMTAAVELLDPPTALFTVNILGLTPTPSTDLKNAIKDALIAFLDTKRPEIPSLGYSLAGATISQIELATVVQNLLAAQDGGSFTSLELVYLTNPETSVVLPIGNLAILDVLNINGSPV